MRLSGEELRGQFLLRPDVVFLNHGSFGACPRPVFEAYQRWQLELERQPVEFLGRRLRDLMAESRAALGSYLGAHPDDLVYFLNATTALNVVARSLSLQPGDEVVSTDHEYGAMDRTWRFICARRGARYLRTPVAVPVTSAESVVEAIWGAVTPRTRVLFLSHVTSPTALILPIEELIGRAAARGILTVIDGAHAIGQIPVDLENLGADFYAGNCHKWLCAPKGSGFLYARRERQALLQPLVVSWGWEAEEPGPSRFIDEHEWRGTRDIAADLAVPAAIAFLEEHEWDDVRGACHALAGEAQARIEKLTGLPGLSPDSRQWCAQMVSVPLPPGDAKELQRRLYEEYRIEVPIVAWNDQRLLRVSVQGYNTRDDITALIDALGRVL